MSQLFECDPKKNKECSKTSCYINGGPCKLTSEEKFKKTQRKTKKEKTDDK